MNPDAIVRLLRVRAVEESDASGATLGWKEREQATREALREAGSPGEPSGSGGLTGPQWKFLSARADLLSAKAGSAVGDVPLEIHMGRWGLGLCLVAFLIGWASHGLGLSRSFDLLAGPFVLVLLWNMAVYVVLSARALQTRRPDGRTGYLSDLVEMLVTRSMRAESPGKARESYLKSLTVWLRSWTGPAVACWFHAGSAFFTLGLLAAVYFRGLFTGYLAAWESTWLNAGGIGLVLGTLLAPASAITGIPLPESTASWEMLERTGSHPGVSAGPWIHLYAVTLALCVLLPRAALSLKAWRDSMRMRSSPPQWSQDEPYLLRVLSLARQDGDIGIAVLPFDIKTPSQIQTGTYHDRIERLVREAWGLEARACALQCAPYGAEDAAWDGPWAESEKCGGALIVFDAHATPEDEVHGVVLEAVLKRFGHTRGGALVAVECARFPGTRLDARLALWQQFAQKHDCRVIPIDQGVAGDPSVHPASRIVRHP